MKTNAFKLMAALFVAALSLGFTSCGDDDDSDGGKTGGSGSDPSGTVTANIRNDGNYLYINWKDEEGYRVETGLSINDANNFVAGYMIYGEDSYNDGIVCVGKVSGIGSIKKVPQSGWSRTCAVQPGYGYVLRSREISNLRDEFGDYRYVRVYVVDYMEGTSGGIIGATIKYQAPWDVR